jgi:hypothetical protein
MPIDVRLSPIQNCPSGFFGPGGTTGGSTFPAPAALRANRFRNMPGGIFFLAYHCELSTRRLPGRAADSNGIGKHPVAVLVEHHALWDVHDNFIARNQCRHDVVVVDVKEAARLERFMHVEVVVSRNGGWIDAEARR